MTQVYKYINGHSPHIMNYIFLIKRNIYNLQNFNVFETWILLRTIKKHGLNPTLASSNMSWNALPNDNKLSQSIRTFKHVPYYSALIWCKSAI